MIEELKADHLFILHLVEEAKRFGGTAETKVLLRRAKAAFEEHRAKEEGWIFPLAREEARVKDEVREALELLGREERSIKEVELFFEAHTDNKKGGHWQFLRAVPGALRRLRQVFWKEEQVLFPALLKVEPVIFEKLLTDKERSG